MIGNRKRIVLPVLLLLGLLCLTGCRVRTTGVAPTEEAAQSGELSASAGERPENESDTGEASAEELRPDAVADPDAEGDVSLENPEAPRKEYDENADAEILVDTALHVSEQGEGDALSGTGSEGRTAMLSADAERTATRILPAEEAERLGISEEAKAAESLRSYYTVLLRERVGSLYECKRLYVYWETAEDHITIHRTDPAHQLLLDSGCYDVSARLTEERLRIDDGWIARKNPDVYVKVVSADILGSSVHSDAAATRVYADLTRREDWQTLRAAREQRVLLLSEKMLQAPHLQLAACLLIARQAYPELFGDLDMQDILQALHEEATGSLTEAIYYYIPGGSV